MVAAGPRAEEKDTGSTVAEAGEDDALHDGKVVFRGRLSRDSPRGAIHAPTIALSEWPLRRQDRPRVAIQPWRGAGGGAPGGFVARSPARGARRSRHAGTAHPDSRLASRVRRRACASPDRRRSACGRRAETSRARRPPSSGTSGQRPRSRIRSSCSTPLLARISRPSAGAGPPARSLTRPPASSTIRMPAATSHACSFSSQ